MKKTLTIAAGFLMLVSCSRNKDPYDASGTFEAVETIVPAEASGIIKQLNLEEGQQLTAGSVVGYIDSTQLYLKRKQLEGQTNAVLSRKPDINSQVAALREQLKQADRERERLSRLVADDAATRKQLDDANSQVAIIKKQIEAQETSLSITSSSIGEETLPIAAQIEQLNDQLARCRIINPAGGTVLAKYAEPGEMAAVGKPLYKIADLSWIILRAYVSGDQFAAIKTGQTVTVLVDDGKGKYKDYKGTIEWISDKAEFTPKTIQTKDERANLVYAVKIRVKNDGYMKIGMYGEVKF